jgi:tRNA-binding EMAP/Myf-like protein
MLSISEGANKNYLAKIVSLTNLRKHSNADKLQVVSIDFQDVIVGLDQKGGDICVYFPVECQIHIDFLVYLNAFRDKELNKDKEKAGFFEKNCRVRAVKLRGEKSMGFIIPVENLESFIGKKIEEPVGTEFNMIGDTEFVRKYEVYKPESRSRNGKVEKRISRLVDGQFHFHIETENLRKNAFLINPEDNISVTYKVHGTSAIFANILVKRKLPVVDKVLSFVGFPIVKEEYDVVYSSRKVVKNEYETKDKSGFYSSDIWGQVKDDIKDVIPKGYTIYGEILGYTKEGKYIQQDYDYGCTQGKSKLQVYRITVTNPDGFVIELSPAQIIEFCERAGLSTVVLFYKGLAKNLYPELDIENHWHEEFIKRLEKDYNDKDCFLCINKVPEEGIVLRKESTFRFDAYKLKSFRFMEFETSQLDNGVLDTESAN